MSSSDYFKKVLCIIKLEAPWFNESEKASEPVDSLWSVDAFTGEAC